MLQMNLSGPAQFYPAQMPQASSRATNAWPRPATSASSTPSPFTLGQTKCGYGYKANQQGVCMSQGCMDGRSPCVVVDGYGRTCSYDQLLAFQSHSGQPACGPAPALPAPPQSPGVPSIDVQQPGIVVGINPSPGTEATVTTPVYKAGIPKWALVVGGLSVVAIIVALLVRR